MKFGLHDCFHNTFCPCFSSFQFMDGIDHLPVCFPFVFQGLCFGISNVVSHSNGVQSVNTTISPFESCFEFSPRTHLMISRPMKFHTDLSQYMLEIKFPTGGFFSKVFSRHVCFYFLFDMESNHEWVTVS